MRRTCNIVYSILKNNKEYEEPKQLKIQCQNSFRVRKEKEKEKLQKKLDKKAKSKDKQQTNK